MHMQAEKWKVSSNKRTVSISSMRIRKPTEEEFFDQMELNMSMTLAAAITGSGNQLPGLCFFEVKQLFYKVRGNLTEHCVSLIKWDTICP